MPRLETMPVQCHDAADKPQPGHDSDKPQPGHDSRRVQTNIVICYPTRQAQRSLSLSRPLTAETITKTQSGSLRRSAPAPQPAGQEQQPEQLESILPPSRS